MINVILFIAFLLGCNERELPNDLDSEDSTKISTVSIDVNAIATDVSQNPTGFCLSFFNDDPKSFASATTSFPDAIKKTKAGSLRFPMGTLAENYLFHEPGDYANAVNGLKPMLASKDQLPKATIFQQAVDENGYYKESTLDFDEFMELCRETNTEPVIMVSAEGHLFNGTTVSYDQLKANAVEWVRYANITKKYNIKYWEIGNEVEHPNTKFTPDTYGALMDDFAKAMKAVDPTIKTGAGLFNKKDWYEQVAKKYSANIDFFVVHLYQMEGLKNEKEYRESASDFISKYRAITDAVKESSPGKQFEWVVSEYSSYFFGDLFGHKNDMMNSMASFERLMGMMAYDDNLAFTHFWVTHNPWNTSLTDADAFDENNNLTPQGRSVQMAGEFLQEKMLKVGRVKGSLPIFASYSPSPAKLTVWVLNKGVQEDEIELNLSGLTGNFTLQQTELQGQGMNDENPVYTSYPKRDISLIKPVVKVKPISINVFVFE